MKNPRRAGQDDRLSLWEGFTYKISSGWVEFIGVDYNVILFFINPSTLRLTMFTILNSKGLYCPPYLICGLKITCLVGLDSLDTW